MTKSAVSRKRRQPKLVHTEDVGEIYLMPDDTYWIESRKPRHRYTSKTEQGAREKLENIKAAGSGNVEGGNTLFSTLLDKFIEAKKSGWRPKKQGLKPLQPGSLKGLKQQVNILRGQKFGTWKLQKFIDERGVRPEFAERSVRSRLR
jgi:hypothetical protein